MIKRVAVGLAVLVALGLTVGWAYHYAMKNAWIRSNEYDIRTEGQLQVGDLAPDLELVKAGDETAVRLSDLYREKPVVLAFGSHT